MGASQEGLDALDALVAEKQRLRDERLDAISQWEKADKETRQLRDALEFWYAAIDKAQRLDNTGGDSAVAVSLNSWDEALHDDRAALAGTPSEDTDVLMKCSICDSQFPTAAERDAHYERCLSQDEALGERFVEWPAGTPSEDT
jgi:hypothetical protein